MEEKPSERRRDGGSKSRSDGEGRTKGSKKARILPLMVVVGLIFAFGFYFFLRSPSAADFRFHQTRYEAIVTRSRAFQFEPWQTGRLWTNAALEPVSLSRNRINHSSMVGMIRVESTASEPYQISIITRDDGHLGTSGYIYSEATDSPPSTADLPSVDRQVGPYWWIAYNNSW